MAELNPNFVWWVNGELHGVPYEFLHFSVACNEVNAYLPMKYFLKMDDKLMNFRKKVSGVDTQLINE